MSESQSWKPASNPWLVAITVTLAVFIEIPGYHHRERGPATYRRFALIQLR